MKTYREIPGPSKAPQEPCYGFVKYDGSNIRFEWSRKRGWYKFGTRKYMMDETNPIFGCAIPTFLEKYGDDLEDVFKKEKIFRGIQNVIVFAEWFGAKSFSGAHKPSDPKDIVLFDVNPIKKGMLGPKEFIDYFGHLKVAEVCFQGNFGKEIEMDVRKERIDIVSKYEINSEIPEGVVFKGGKGHKLWMCKVKTEKYKAALREQYDVDWERFWE